MMSMILIAVMHANPSISATEAVDVGREFIKGLYAPNTRHKWKKQADRVGRVGIRAVASRIRRELFKLI